MPAFDPLTYRYASRRNVVYAQNAVACTSVPLGAQIGLDVMKSGGSAVDAAVAMAAAMPLLEPTGNGLGSNCFALVWIERDKRLYGLNASGVAPMALSAEKVRAMGYTEMPKAGWLPTMVPGAPAGWAELNRRFGTKSLAELFAPAISYAEEGYPVPVNVARQWERDSRRIAKAMAENAVPHEYWWKSFIKPDGTPYRAGELFRFPDYAATLRSLAATDCESLEDTSLTVTCSSISCRESRSPVTITQSQFALPHCLPIVPITSSASQPSHSKMGMRMARRISFIIGSCMASSSGIG